MKPICPNCHSSKVIVNMDADSPFSFIDHLCSSAALSGLGASICKYYKLNPAIGIIVGNAIASAISLAKDKLQPPLLVMAAKPSYLCSTCQHTFSI